MNINCLIFSMMGSVFLDAYTELTYRAEQMQLYQRLALHVIEIAQPGDDIEELAAQVLENYNKAYRFFLKQQSEKAFKAYDDK